MSNTTPHAPQSPPQPHHLRKILRTPRNVFGLVRQYFARHFPEHDPDELVTSEELSDVPTAVGAAPEAIPSYYPYPNKWCFLLGKWFWDRGNQKSRNDFKELVDIVGDPSYDPKQVGGANWAKIDRQLGGNNYDKYNEWEDKEEEDAGWNNTPISIEVPFTNRAIHPGTKQFTVPNFYHRSLVDVIQEKMANPVHDRTFHYEPYELRFDSGHLPETRVHGELYTSPAFIQAHNNLQASPAEPGCDRPRVVLGLMFSSDSTHLTSFGSASIWPLYCYFGNESKYRRCKPTEGLCSHIAYFQKVIDCFL